MNRGGQPAKIALGLLKLTVPPEPLIETITHLAGGHRRHARGDQLDGQRDAVKAAAELHDPAASSALVMVKRGATLRARSTNSLTAAESMPASTSNQGNGYTCSSTTPSPSRLVAKILMTGVGGVGKTRLATEVAARLADEFPDGVWVFELAAVTDPDAVPDAVAAVLGITQQPGKNMSESVAAALKGRMRLLVIDNCEHALDAAADLVEAIVARSATVLRVSTLTRHTKA